MLSAQFPWEELDGLVGQRLKTLAEASPFLIDRLESDHVVLEISTGEERWISRRAFRLAWAPLVRGDPVSREDLDRIEDRQGTYIAAILSKLEGIEFIDNPVSVYPKLHSKGNSDRGNLPDVSEFLAWAANNCPYEGEEKKLLRESVLSECSAVVSWKELEKFLVARIDESSDSRLTKVLRRLLREAREYLKRRL